MRTLKLKTISNLAAQAVHAEIAHPNAKPGEAANIRTVEITGIPAAVEDWQVLKAWAETCDCSYLGGDGSNRYPRHTYAYSEIGSGLIIPPTPRTARGAR
jgi:hypothetical protein